MKRLSYIDDARCLNVNNSLLYVYVRVYIHMPPYDGLIQDDFHLFSMQHLQLHFNLPTTYLFRQIRELQANLSFTLR